MGAGGSPRQCAINLKRGLPTATNLGGAEGGLQGAIRGSAFIDYRHPFMGWGAGWQVHKWLVRLCSCLGIPEQEGRFPGGYNR